MSDVYDDLTRDLDHGLRHIKEWVPTDIGMPATNEIADMTNALGVPIITMLSEMEKNKLLTEKTAGEFVDTMANLIILYGAACWNLGRRNEQDNPTPTSTIRTAPETPPSET